MKYFSMFSGIGGFELGIQRAFDSRPDLRNRSEGLPEDSTNTEEPQVRADCIGYSEIDKYAIKVYERQFNGHTNYGDATTINPTELPDFDLLVGGFPCQAFSVAGKRAGFNDTRGTLFFDIARILKEKQPRHLVLENVKGLLSHDSGRTFTTIIGVLTDLGYFVEWQVLNSKDFGVPQNRERVFIVGHLRGTPRPEVFPIAGDGGEDTRLSGHISNTLTARYEGAQAVGTYIGESKLDAQSVKIPEATKKGYAEASVGQAINLSVPNSKTRRGRVSDIAPTIDTGMQLHTLTEDVRIRRLTPIECERLQGFPDNWTAQGTDGPISDTQRYKMCGNGVTVNVVQAVIERLLATQVTDLASEHKTERSDRELANKNIERKQ